MTQQQSKEKILEEFDKEFGDIELTSKIQYMKPANGIVKQFISDSLDSYLESVIQKFIKENGYNRSGWDIKDFISQSLDTYAKEIIKKCMPKKLELTPDEKELLLDGYGQGAVDRQQLINQSWNKCIQTFQNNFKKYKK